jgi:hypothetical protein
MKRTPSLIAALLLALSASGCGGATRTASATGGYPCDDAALTASQPADVCGSVVRTMRARRTRSGRHGYFYVALSSGQQIEIVSNLDAMAEAPNGAPPAQWPWVTPGEYVYVQGRYYYDNPSNQGIDWTEDNTSRSWPHTGYVVVCDAHRANCTQYQ